LEYGPIIGTGIRFVDGSILNFEERISHDEEMVSYLYEYIRTDTGFFFGYDKEVEINIKKPVHHWHVGIKDFKWLKELLIGLEERNKLLGLELIGLKECKKLLEEYKKLLEQIPKDLIDHNGPHYNAAPNRSLHDFLGVIIQKMNLRC
jgi:hypothetical protein